VLLAPGLPCFSDYYKSSEVWSKESLERRAMALAKSEPAR
jgi:hypothetical protein